jgi:hypothetical protein
MKTVKRIALAAAVPAVLAIGAAPASATAGSPNAANSSRQSIAWVPPNWTVIVDDTQTISIAVPSTWTDVDTVPLRSDAGTPGPWISATTNQEVMFPADGVADTFGVPGVVFTAAPYNADTAAMIAAAAEFYGQCTPETLGTFDNGQYAGHIQAFSACGGTTSRLVHVAANPADASFTAVLLIQLTGAQDDPATVSGFVHSFGRHNEGR